MIFERPDAVIWPHAPPPQSESQLQNVARMRQELLEWYDRSKRDLPWRRTQDPYAIWVSEIMLQQTRVAVVIERYKAFLKRFPTVQALAEADEQDVLALWSGLGYYRRARMLHKAAQAVVAEHGGKMPPHVGELRKLPGIGSYTAAAIASIAHGEPIAVVDGNVERVLSRIRGWESHDAVGEAAVRRKVEEFAAGLVDPRAPWRLQPGHHGTRRHGLHAAQSAMPGVSVGNGMPHAGRAQDAQTRAHDESRNCVRAGGARMESAGTEVLLEQRAAANTVMPGMWELPAIAAGESTTDLEERLTVRHAIMQVNYMVRVYALTPETSPAD